MDPKKNSRTALKKLIKGFSTGLLCILLVFLLLLRQPTAAFSLWLTGVVWFAPLFAAFFLVSILLPNILSPPYSLAKVCALLLLATAALVVTVAWQSLLPPPLAVPLSEATLWAVKFLPLYYAFLLVAVAIQEYEHRKRQGLR